MSPTRLLLAFVLGLAPHASAQVTSARQDVEAYLKAANFPPADVAALEQGSVIARAVSNPDDGEMVVVGVAKIRATREQTVAYYGQMVTYVDGQVTLAFGKFSNPAALADVQKLTFDRDDVEELKSCRPGDCDVKFGGPGLQKLRSTVDGNAPNYADRFHTFARQAAVDYVTAYRREGNAALVTYNDRSVPVSVQQQWKGLLTNSPYLHHYYPELMEYLDQFPRRQLPGGSDILYWVNENYGLKPVISIVHAVVYQPPNQADRTVVAQKQIYASHYYDASLALATVIAASVGDTPATYIVYVNRSRGDALKGGFGGLKRNVARDQAENAARQTLGTIKSVLEQSAGAR